MEFNYVAYDKYRKVIKGKVNATNEGAAHSLITSNGYQVLSLKAQPAYLSSEKLNMSLTNISPKEIIMFSRQMALLLSSGTDIVAALDLLQSQVNNKEFKKRLNEVAADIRSGSSLSNAMRKYPKVFPTIYWRAVSAGEKSGNMETVMRQMADFMEKRMLTQKKIKGALSYPIMVLVAAVVVIAIMVQFVIPSFSSLYVAFGANLPKSAAILMNSSSWLKHNGLFVLIGAAIIAGVIVSASKTKRGKYEIDKAMLRMPVIGRITNLNELARLCRTMSLLFKVGLPLPDIMSLSAQNTNNAIVAESISGIHQDLIRGEGLSKPMTKRPLFLPLMVQMVSVGEETGNLDNTLATVAETYEVESDDRTAAAIGMIQPIMTVVLGAVVALLATTMVTAMYGIYGQVK
jgi:type IV pilus assembly protein PilC